MLVIMLGEGMDYFLLEIKNIFSLVCEWSIYNGVKTDNERGKWVIIKKSAELLGL